MIVITGAYGFIGSCLASFLNQKGVNNLVLVDDFTKTEKANNIKHLDYLEKIERSSFIEWFEENASNVEYVFHLGARTDTTEFNQEVFDELNLNYSKSVWKVCSTFKIPLIYASSAATYGDGEKGYLDGIENVKGLEPLNPYGNSKQQFDKWVISQEKQPPFWAGLKFFNVFGPNEYHKGRMASVVYHAYNKIEESGEMKLFKSHRPDFKDGEQSRDFVYVKEVLDIIWFLKNNEAPSDIYNVGTGKARSFIDLVRAVFKAMSKEENIGFIDTPEDIRDKYQYFTEANMERLNLLGYQSSYRSLEDAVFDYISSHLSQTSFF